MRVAPEFEGSMTVARVASAVRPAVPIDCTSRGLERKSLQVAEPQSAMQDARPALSRACRTA